MGNPYKAKTRRSVAPAVASVPDGTIGEILKWVGEDKDRAKRAYTTESKAEEPRKTLLTKLDEVLDG